MDKRSRFIFAAHEKAKFNYLKYNTYHSPIFLFLKFNVYGRTIIQFWYIVRTLTKKEINRPHPSRSQYLRPQWGQNHHPLGPPFGKHHPHHHPQLQGMLYVF